jgi:hypothetical protein
MGKRVCHRDRSGGVTESKEAFGRGSRISVGWRCGLRQMEVMKRTRSVIGRCGKACKLTHS